MQCLSVYKIKLSSVISSPIITTDGFSLFNNREKASLIRKLAQNGGVIVITDSDGAGKVTTSSWKDEVNATNTRQVPNRTMVHDLKRDLMGITPKFIAVGHGFCMKLD